MKTLNLISVVNAKKNFSAELFQKYLNNFDTKIKENELNDLESLIIKFQNCTNEVEIFNEFFLSFTINQISKEFDLLRFGHDCIVNIELKSENTGDRIYNQLIRNKYYLNFLGKKTFNFTYVAKENQIFYLDDNELKEVDVDFLINILLSQKIEKIEDITKLFNPSNYLVSPFNSTDEFIQNQYFLTEHQEVIKDKVLNLKIDDKPCFMAIRGSAGTGKTLMIYDIAKEYLKNSSKVLVVHCGILNSGHNKLINEYSWPIIPIKKIDIEILHNFDVLIFDEVQRIRMHQIKNVLDQLEGSKAKCIFAYDPLQCLESNEIRNNIPEYIKSRVFPKEFKLTDKIRTNKEVSGFIKCLLNRFKPIIKQDYSNINIQYFSKTKDAQDYMKILSESNWKIINYTPSLYKTHPYFRYKIQGESSVHEVVGQEFDKVVAVIDEFFYYNEKGDISTNGWNERPYYHPTKMLFQILTRTRKELMLIIVNNKKVLERALDILTEK